MVDDLDIRIAEALQTDARQSRKQLAKQLGVSANTIRRRMAKLIRQQVIRIVALPNPVTALHRVWVTIGLTVSSGYYDQVVAELLNHRECTMVMMCLGRFDIMISVRLKSNEELAEFLTVKLLRIKGITHSETMLIAVPRRYYDFFWLTVNNQVRPAEKKMVGYSKGARESEVTLDDLDESIVEELNVDATVTSRQLAEQLGVSPSTIRTRLYRLVARNAVKIIALVNPFALGYAVWANIGIKVVPGWAEQVVDALLQYPSCYFSGVVLGRFDVLAGVRFKSSEELAEFINVDLPKNKGIIEIETILFIKPYRYYSFVWPQAQNTAGLTVPGET